MATIDALARKAGYRIRRGRTDPERLWLVDADGRLLTPASGIDAEGVRDVLLRLAEPQPLVS